MEYLITCFVIISDHLFWKEEVEGKQWSIAGHCVDPEVVEANLVCKKQILKVVSLKYERETKYLV